MSGEKKYGFYARWQEELGGSSVYLTPDGREVVVSIVSICERHPFETDRQLPEGMIRLGEVTRCVRQHYKGSLEIIWHDMTCHHGRRT